MELWPHQETGIQDVLAAIDAGHKRICLTSPTGAGKSVMIQRIVQTALKAGRKVALYSNRKMMIDQLSHGLMEAGIYHGVRAADYDDELDYPFQVCSVQTEVSRVIKRGTWIQHACRPGDIAIIDEGHLHANGKVLDLRKQHVAAGAITLDVTATPLSMGGVCDVLIQAGTMSQLRECGALVAAHHFGCDEPDLAAWKKAKKNNKVQDGTDPSERQQAELIMTPDVMGRIGSWYYTLNPTFRPALLFGPNVAGSLWFAERFWKDGISTAHIDADDVWIKGAWYRADQKAKEAVRDGSKSGDIKIVCNRFVLREGVDWPWIEHIILAFIAGNVQTYLQVGGRGLRASPGKERLIVQDHGGAWWRHGSLNEDRHWSLEYTPDIVYGLRAAKLRKAPNLNPRRCPKCGQIMARRTCLCGYEFPPGKPSRPVVGTDGRIRELTGDIFKPRSICKAANGPAKWERMYWRSIRRKLNRKDGSEYWTGHDRTFNAAMALFAQENYWQYPDPNWPFMPREDIDLFRLVADVPPERLIPKE